MLKNIKFRELRKCKLSFHFRLSATYYLKNCYATLYYSSSGKGLLKDDSNAICSRSKDYYSLKIGWSNGKWNLSASAINIFRRNWLSQTSWIDSRWYDSVAPIHSRCGAAQPKTSQSDIPTLLTQFP